jgi:hypothetical protein
MIVKKLPKVNHPMGENFPNLVTLFLANQTN